MKINILKILKLLDRYSNIVTMFILAILYLIYMPEEFKFIPIYIIIGVFVIVTLSVLIPIFIENKRKDNLKK